MISPSEQITGTLHKCRCNSPWCPDCSPRIIGAHCGRCLDFFDWKKTRFVTLTIDRALFPGLGGQEIFELLKKRQSVQKLCREVSKEFGGVWAAFLEWHKDGLPHWHILIQTQAGKKGQLTGEVLRSLWGLGRVHETYFETEGDFKDLLGYCKKKGYFSKGKAYQTRLPLWAQEVSYRIRRFCCSRAIPGKPRKPPLIIREEEEGVGVEKKRKPYKLILESCGQGTMIEIEYSDGGKEYRKIGTPIRIVTEIFSGHGFGKWIDGRYIIFVRGYRLLGQVLDLCGDPKEGKTYDYPINRVGPGPHRLNDQAWEV